MAGLFGGVFDCGSEEGGRAIESGVSGVCREDEEVVLVCSDEVDGLGHGGEIGDLKAIQECVI
jgi:hypothetical protein